MPATKKVAKKTAAKKPGLYANIHAKQERIAHGSDEHMRKPGAKGAPSSEAFEKSEQTTAAAKKAARKTAAKKAPARKAATKKAAARKTAARKNLLVLRLQKTRLRRLVGLLSIPRPDWRRPGVRRE